MVQAYTGVDNLEVMREAANYQNYLVGLVASGAGNASKRLIDFGAGLGSYAQSLTDRGYSVACIESDDKLRRRLKDEGLEAHKELKELGEGSAEFIYSLNVLEHIKDDEAIIGQLGSVLAPGGKLLLYVPAFQVLYSSMDRKVGHYRRYSLSKLSRLIEQPGLKVERAQYVDSLGFFATLLFKFAGNNDGDINSIGLRIYDRAVLPVSLWLDRLTGRFVGKNLLIVASKLGS